MDEYLALARESIVFAHDAVDERLTMDTKTNEVQIAFIHRPVCETYVFSD
jgi:hypothetical protein